MAFSPLRRAAGALFDFNLNRMLRELYAGMPITQAENVVFSTYGDRVSVEQKAKNLNKFGRTNNADSGVRTTVGQFQGTVVNETLVYANSIDSVVSSNAGDTQTINIEGQSFFGGNLTFVTQDVTLTGQTPVSLPESICRCTRLFIKDTGTPGSPQAVFAGNIAVYDSSATAVAAGVPATPTATKVYVLAGQTQTRKCQTAISVDDYYFITELEVSVSGSGPAAIVEFQIETAAVNGGVWRPTGAELTVSKGNSFQKEFNPYLIVPKNHDVRVVATSDTNNTVVTADLQGVLAKILVV